MRDEALREGHGLAGRAALVKIAGTNLETAVTADKDAAVLAAAVADGNRRIA
jgi:hypothetical protein